MGNAQTQSPERAAERSLPASAKLESRLAPSPAPAPGCVEDGEYLPEDGMFRMDPSDQADDEVPSSAYMLMFRSPCSRIAVLFVFPP